MIRVYRKIYGENEMKSIAIIPARSGSKGLKDKNIKKIADKPLLAYSIEAAIQSACFQEVMVSTDSEMYAEIAEQYGAKVPFLRSEENASDHADSWMVVQEVLEQYNKSGYQFDTVCLLQPTSPLRTSEDIINAYCDLLQRKADAITSVCEVDHSPNWSMILPENHSLKQFRNDAKSSLQRQKLDKYYRLNGAIYIRKIQYACEKVDVRNDREFAYIMDRQRSIDIDTIDDFEYAEYLMKKLKKDKK